MSELQIVSDALDYPDIISRIKGIYSSCTEVEQQQLMTILEELSDKGYSQTLEQIYLVDFKEIPVSIDRFLTDPYYLGSSNDCGRQIYPGWWDAYHAVFDNQRDVYEVILSGATRIGKTSSAVSMAAYMTYLIMCYRNPQRYFDHKDTMIPVIAFANLTKDLAKGVAFQEFCNTIKLSPWFNEHGKFSSTAKVPLYTPENNGAQFVVSSDSSHILGMATWCVVGDTEIVTANGVFKIADLDNKLVSVLQYDFVNSEYCYADAEVKLTKYVKSTIRLTLDDGTVFEGTPDHRVMLTDGTYKRLDELTEADEVLAL